MRPALPRPAMVPRLPTPLPTHRPGRESAPTATNPSRSTNSPAPERRAPRPANRYPRPNPEWSLSLSNSGHSRRAAAAAPPSTATPPSERSSTSTATAPPPNGTLTGLTDEIATLRTAVEAIAEPSTQARRTTPTPRRPENTDSVNRPKPESKIISRIMLRQRNDGVLLGNHAARAARHETMAEPRQAPPTPFRVDRVMVQSAPTPFPASECTAPSPSSPPHPVR